jgi:hypothetical protein
MLNWTPGMAWFGTVALLLVSSNEFMHCSTRYLEQFVAAATFDTHEFVHSQEALRGQETLILQEHAQRSKPLSRAVKEDAFSPG